jgi:phage tail-like protein
MPSSIINRFSTIATDPLRNFRFYAEFTKAGDEAFDKRILTSSTTNPATAGYSDGWIGGFTFISGLNINTQSIPYREGGYNTTVHQIPGQTTFAPISLQRGVILGTRQHWDWMKQLFSTVQAGTGRSNPAQNFRCDVEIAVLTHPIAGSGSTTELTGSNYSDHVSARFQVYNAWPTSVAYSDLNAGDNAIFVEQMTLVHEGFELNWGTDLTPGGSAPRFN